MAFAILLSGTDEERAFWRPAFAGCAGSEYLLLEASPGTGELNECLQLGPDLVILCPSRDAAAILPNAPDCPVLACGPLDAPSKLRALRAGAIHCETAGELNRKVAGLLRAAERRTPVHAGGLVADPRTRRVASHGGSVRLTHHEFLILDRLMRNAGTVVSREILMQGFTPSGRALEVHISRLRKKLGAGPAVIQSVRKSGYLFVDASTEELS